MALKDVEALRRRPGITSKVFKAIGTTALAAALTFATAAARAEDWIGTWTASVQPVWEPEGYYSEEKEKIRVAVNEWIRSSGAFDGVIDFDKVVRDPAKPSHIQARYDKGDHLHPNAAGYKAMAESIDLGQLLGNR